MTLMRMILQQKHRKVRILIIVCILCIFLPVIGDIPELERIPRYKNHDEDERFSTDSNPSNYMDSQMRMSPLGDREPERRKYQDSFPFFNSGKWVQY